jgi:hypothetical protein
VVLSRGRGARRDRGAADEGLVVAGHQVGAAARLPQDGEDLGDGGDGLDAVALGRTEEEAEVARRGEATASAAVPASSFVPGTAARSASAPSGSAARIPAVR